MDCDGVAIDFRGGVIRTAKRALASRSCDNRASIQALIDGPPTDAAMDELLMLLHDRIYVKGWCAELPLYEEAIPWVQKWQRSGAQIVWVTAPLPGFETWEYERKFALHRDFGSPSSNVISTSRKEAVDGLTLIEDKAAIARSWNTRRVPLGRHPAMLIERAWNRDGEDLLRLSWQEIDAVVEHLIAGDLARQGTP